MAFRTTAVMRTAFKKFAYNWSGFNRYGLYRDDCLYEDEDVKEALRRLPPDVYDERNYRLRRAIQLSIQKIHLPKEQWTRFEEDKLYLTPIVNQVIKERLEREKWDNEH